MLTDQIFGGAEPSEVLELREVLHPERHVLLAVYIGPLHEHPQPLEAASVRLLRLAQPRNGLRLKPML
jgi:hypothetical protein